MKKRLIPVFSALILSAALTLAVFIPGAATAGVSVSAAAGSKFKTSAADFTVNVFKRAYSGKKGGNSMVSPLSVMTALSMAANGANAKTLAEMEKALGINMSELNPELSAYIKNLPSSKNVKVNIANSIWYRDGFAVKDSFLKTNKKFYSAKIQKSKFDKKAVSTINNWVSKNTDGMIDEILDEIPSEAVMYLINAIAFDGKWEEAYKEPSVRDGEFASYGGKKQNVRMMYSEENVYINDGKAVGFIKPYKDGNYSFAALLPNEGVNIDDYIAGLTGESLTKTLNSRSYEKVAAGLPKFKSEYGIEMSALLKSMGMKRAFDDKKADFSKLGGVPGGNIYISEVIHKTFIEVDEEGTKAAAVTEIGMARNAMPLKPKTVILDRPFVYAIIDNSTNLPIFIGVLTSVD